MTGLPLVIAFVIAVVLMIVAISKFKVHPFLSIMGVSLLLALVAGIPLTSGFIGKWAVFSSAMSAGAWPVVVVAVLVSGVAAYIYLKLIVVMYFREPSSSGETVAVVAPSMLTSAAIAVTVVATLVLGVAPDPLLDLLSRAGDFIR